MSSLPHLSRRSWGLLAGTALSLLACFEERVDPAPANTSSDPPDAGEGGAPPPPPPPIREVYERNPIGVPIENLMVDGDIELSIVPGGAGSQAPWFAFRAQGAVEVPILAETGGLCRTGLRCGRVPKNTDVLGWGVAAPDLQPHRMSVWLKPIGDAPNPDAPCDLADVYVMDCLSFELRTKLTPADAPASDGWCQHQAEYDGSRTGVCMYISVGNNELMFDSATLLPAPDLAGGASSQRPTPVPTDAKSAERKHQTQRAAVEMRDFLRKRRVVGRPPTSIPKPGTLGPGLDPVREPTRE